MEKKAKRLSVGTDMLKAVQKFGKAHGLDNEAAFKEFFIFTGFVIGSQNGKEALGELLEEISKGLKAPGDK